MLEHCPIHGPLIITTRSRVRAAMLHHSRHHQLVAKVAFMTVDSRIVTPLPDAIWLLEQAAKTLKQTNPHGGQAVLTGIPTDQLRKLDVVMALVEQKQRSIENDALEDRAELDKQDSLARFAKLQPVARKVAQGKMDAETVMKAIRAEPDQLLAISTLRHLLLRTHELSVGDVDVITADQASSGIADFNASRPYNVTMSVSAIKVETCQVNCVLQGGEDLEPIFQAGDLGHRVLQFQVGSDKLMLLGYCMLFGLHPKALISVRVTLTSKGPSYRCSLIAFHDEDALLASIRQAITQQTPALFS